MIKNKRIITQVPVVLTMGPDNIASNFNLPLKLSFTLKRVGGKSKINLTRKEIIYQR
jgi:RNA recognition motif-containing protein